MNLFEPEDQLDRFATVLKYGKPSYNDLIDIIQLGNKHYYKDPEKHLRVIYKAFYNYNQAVEEEFRINWQRHAPPISFETRPTLSMLAFLHQYSWTIEEFNIEMFNLN